MSRDRKYPVTKNFIVFQTSTFIFWITKNLPNLKLNIAEKNLQNNF